jgi:hypothetical protein
MILILTERAFSRFLHGVAANLVTGDGSYVITNDGLKILLKNGVSYPFPVLRGQDDQEVSAPCVIAYAQQGEQAELGTMTHVVDVQFSLLFPTDESMKQPQLLELFEYAAAQLVEALYRDDLCERVSELEPGYTLLAQLSKWAIESSWTNRNRLMRMRARFHAVNSDSEPINAS